MAEKAMALCGAAFRLHGRDEHDGLDCIGVADQCLAAAGVECRMPNGYSIRGGSEDSINHFMADIGFDRLTPESEMCNGDFLLVRPSPVQWHFLIRAGNGFVHAHAGLGKVVFCPGDAPWPVVAIFRLKEA
ncbi:peptidoglycan endopeptidase [Parasphingorhabdus flavimaris]|uniref:peptidoglycan endopeptidase n=1 Tax=Parasphingorhabdus flavimaris TaxID=266812 RepID=UPI003001A203